MAERLGKDAFSWLPPERQLAALQVPEPVGAAAAGVLGHHMAAILEQTLAAELEERGATDGEAAAGLLGGEPERIVHGGSNGGCCLGQRERLPKGGWGVCGARIRIQRQRTAKERSWCE
jgi:hypothetical protein